MSTMLESHTDPEGRTVTTFHVPEADRPRFRQAVLAQGGQVTDSAPSGVMGSSYYVTARFAPVPDFA